MDTPFGSIIGAAASHINSMQNGLFNLLGQRQQFKQNLELARYQNEMSMQNWREQNAYNSPVAQMERLKAAGINPFMVAGHVSGSGNASGVPSYPNITGIAPNYGDSLQVATNTRNQNFQQLLNWFVTRKDIEKKDAEIEQTKASTANIRQQTASELWRYNNLFPLNKTRAQKEINNLIERNFLLSLQSQGQSIRNEMDKYNLDFILPIEQEIKQWQSKDWQWKLNKYNPAQIALMKSQKALNNANVTLSNSRTIGQGHENQWLQTRNRDASSYWKNVPRLQVKDIELGTQKYIHDVMTNELFDAFGTNDASSIKLLGMPLGTFTLSTHYPFRKSYRKVLFNKKF